MRKTKNVSSGNVMPKKRRNLQEYFDISHNNVATPNQRSLPKYKNIFNGPRNHKSVKKDQMGTKRYSQSKIVPNQRKENISPPHRPHRSNQKPLRFEESINR